MRRRQSSKGGGRRSLRNLDCADVVVQREPFVHRKQAIKTTTFRNWAVAQRERPLALGYVRVSTSEQADDGASLEAQRNLLSAEAVRRGWDVEILADEGYSAKAIENRPALLSALDRLDKGSADVLLVLRVDRLSRSVSDFAALMARSQRRGWSLVALDLGVDTSTPAGDLMAHVLASVAQYERKVIGQRTREGMAQRRAEGVHVGRPPALPDSTVERIVKERSTGATLSSIAAGLAADDVPTGHGGRWHASTVRKVLSRKSRDGLLEIAVEVSA